MHISNGTSKLKSILLESSQPFCRYNVVVIKDSYWTLGQYKLKKNAKILLFLLPRQFSDNSNSAVRHKLYLRELEPQSGKYTEVEVHK